MRKIYGVVLFFMLLVGLSACDQLNFNKRRNDKPVARVGDKVLYHSELADNLPETLNPVDSISFAQSYIEKWVRNHLLLAKAEENIDDDILREIDYMIENYRISLTVFKFQQMLLHEKLDTTVKRAEIDSYYQKHAGNFKLDSCVVKAIYVQVPKSTPDAYKIKSWMYSSREEDLINLEDYCYQNARNFYMGEEWVYFSTLLSKTPKTVKDPERYLRSNKGFSDQDSLYKYYVAIREYRLPQDTTPQIFVEDQVRDIIINHRKVDFIKSLENSVYREGVNQKKFNIYTK